MASEGQKQKRLIESGFLDDIGSQKTTPLQFDGVEKVLVDYLGKMVTAMQDNLNTVKNGKEVTASGALSESIRFEYTKSGNTYEGLIFMTDYADYVNQGVQGIGPNSKNTTSPYKFKYAFPSKKMQQSLILWVREKSVLSDITAPKGLKGKYTRNYLRNKDRAKDLAIRLGTSIKRKGIAATHFKDDAVGSVMEELKAALAAAAASDIKINIQTDLLQ